MTPTDQRVVAAPRCESCQGDCCTDLLRLQAKMHDDDGTCTSDAHVHVGFVRIPSEPCPQDLCAAICKVSCRNSRLIQCRACYVWVRPTRPIDHHTPSALLANCGRMAAGSSALCKAASSMTRMRELASMLQTSPHQTASLATNACSGAEPVQHATPVIPSLRRSPTAASCISAADHQPDRSVGACC